MTHEFFKTKRPWSRYKDMILRFYLERYIPKVASLKKPVLIVDCFAGCAAFADGEPGSPLIIAPLVRTWRAEGMDVRAEFIEADADNFRSLERCLGPYTGLAKVHHGTFLSHLGGLAERAQQNTVFLYVDPYTVKGLMFDQMSLVYEQIRRSSASVEVLLNFNVVTFMRWALAAVRRQAEFPSEAVAEADYLGDDPAERVEMATLDAIAGGCYWRDIAAQPCLSFDQKLGRFTDLYLDRMVRPFGYAAYYEIKEKYGHKVPKYALIFGTRHPDGIELMNEGMCRARLEFLGNQFNKGTLFDCTPTEEVPDTQQLRDDLLKCLDGGKRLTRKSLRLQAILGHFCRFQKADINAAIGELVKGGRLFSSTGKTRINDDVVLSTTPFDGGDCGRRV